MTSDNSKAIAEALRQAARSLALAADLIDGNVAGTSDKQAREAAVLREFDVKPSAGLSRAQASAAFKRHGIDPRACGSWVQGGYIARQGDCRWLTEKGRDWADAHAA